MLAGLIAMPVAVLPGHVGPAKPVTATASAGASNVPPASVPALTIGVSDGRKAAKAGDQLTYVVSVRDSGTRSAPHLKITQTLSAGLEYLSASPRGTASNGQIVWYAGIPAGGTQTFQVVARVTRPPARLLRLAAVACAAADGSSRPIVCAAHLDRLPAAAAASAPGDAGPSRPVLLASAVAVLVVLAAGVLAAIAFRRLRLRRRPA